VIFNKASDLLIFWSDLQQSDYCRKSDFWNVPTLHKDFLLQESGLTLRVVVLWSLESSLREILVEFMEVEVIVRLCLFVVVWKIRVYGFRLHFGTLQIEICAESRPFWGWRRMRLRKKLLSCQMDSNLCGPKHTDLSMPNAECRIGFIVWIAGTNMDSAANSVAGAGYIAIALACCCMEFCRICTIVPCDFTHHHCCDSHSASQLVRMSISVHFIQQWIHCCICQTSHS